jgi:hypothetical protein
MEHGNYQLYGLEAGMWEAYLEIRILLVYFTFWGCFLTAWSGAGLLLGVAVALVWEIFWPSAVSGYPR